MRKSYRLHPQVEAYGRTLWNNLVIGHITSTLDQDNPDYTRLTPPEKIENDCMFKYKDIAKVRVIKPNSLVIEATSDENLRTAESDLMAICERKGCPLDSA